MKEMTLLREMIEANVIRYGEEFTSIDMEEGGWDLSARWTLKKMEELSSNLGIWSNERTSRCTCSCGTWLDLTIAEYFRDGEPV